MSDQFLGEIRCVGFNFAPFGWASCDGQILSLSQNTALFSLLGTNFGGNGSSTFGLPNLQGSNPMCWGDGVGLTPRTIGEVGGEPAVQLTQQTMPLHTHVMQNDEDPAKFVSPTNNLVSGIVAGNSLYNPLPTNKTNFLAPPSTTGSSLPHNNMGPYVTLFFCIAMQGIYPQRN